MNYENALHINLLLWISRSQRLGSRQSDVASIPFSASSISSFVRTASA